MRKKFLAAALALGISFFGGWGKAQAEYYEMYNPQTGVAGSATIYDTTCGTILEFLCIRWSVTKTYIVAKRGRWAWCIASLQANAISAICR